MKRRVKWIKQKKNGKVYRHAWIGYSYRNKNGTPDFCREISLRKLPVEVIEQIDYALRSGKELKEVMVSDVKFLDSYEIGGYWSCYCLMEELGLLEALCMLEDKHRKAIESMIMDRVVHMNAHSKLGLYEYIDESNIERVIDPEKKLKIELNDYYIALEKLYENQRFIEQFLYRRNGNKSQLYFYDITSSYFEGEHCPLAEYGYNRDGKKGKKQIVIGLVTDERGQPVSIEVFRGNTSDQMTVLECIDKLREEFGIEEMIFVGDRGMLTKARRKDLNECEYERVKHISALPRKEFMDFLEDQNHPLQPGLFDRHKLVEVEFDNIRYILSFNPEKEAEDRRTRLALLKKTEEKLNMISRNVNKGRWKNEDVIAKKIHTWINHWNMAKFFDYEYGYAHFSFSIKEDKIKQYESIDGFYVIVTDVLSEKLSTQQVREKYKSLSKVETAFRTLKTTEIFMRPIRHWNPVRVRGHVFMCTLAYLVIWKARQVFSEFIIHSPVEDSSHQNDIHSLRLLWENLNKTVKIAKIQIGNSLNEQLKPLDQKTIQLLKAANASFNVQRKRQLKIM